MLGVDFLSFLAKAFEEVTGGATLSPNWHHDAIANQLAEVEAGRSQRLIVTMPPRNLKSIAISVAWVAWMLGRDPSWKFVCVSYSNDLALKHARDCRRIMRSDWYRRVFPRTRLAKGEQAEGDFATSAGGGRLSTSVGGTLTGRGGDIVIIDDHINLLPDNPLRGVNDDSLGPRFPDMSAPYDRELVAAAREAALRLAIPAHKGVLVAVAGPNLETRAEYRMLRAMGADIVGMSTIPEVIVARHASMRAVAFSVVTDMCLPDALEEADIDQIIEVAGRGGERLEKLIPEVLKAV